MLTVPLFRVLLPDVVADSWCELSSWKPNINPEDPDGSDIGVMPK